jgi:3'(2'), 5'-bisphosphate nucleotidase
MIKNVIQTARKAGEAILSYYSEEIRVFEKDDNSPLTKADLAAHHIILDALSAIDPETPIISEESGVPTYEKRKSWNRFWIVDPLDGTKEFIKKNDEFTVNIALIEKGEPILGVVYIPAKKQLFYAEKGKGSFRIHDEGEPERIFSTPADKSMPLKVAASRSHQSKSLEHDLKEQGIHVKELIVAGSSLKFCLVAQGIADIYRRTGPTMEWDVAAGDCIYRNSAQEGQHASPLRYNKLDLKNEGFIIGL